MSCYILIFLKITFTFQIINRSVTLIPEESEDMWHAYNLVAEGDSLKSTTIR